MNKDMDSRILGTGRCHESFTSSTVVASPDACKSRCVADLDCMYYSYTMSGTTSEAYTCQLFSKQSGCTLDCNCKVKLNDDLDGTGASFTAIERDVWINLPPNRKNKASRLEVSGYGCEADLAGGDNGDAENVKLQVTGCDDPAWNGFYFFRDTDHWQLDSSHEIYTWDGKWRIAQMGVSVYAHVIGAHGYSSPTLATFDHGCVVSEVPDLGTYMASDHAPFSREWGWDSFQSENDKVNSVRLRCSATPEDLWQTVVVTRPCQGDAEALISAKREEMVANTQELVELTNELKKLEEAMEHQQALIDANLCAIVLASLKKVSDFLNNFLCQIMSGAMWVLSKGLDAAAAATPGLNAYILPLKAKPICFPESLYGWWGKKFAAVVKGGMTYAYAKLMCLLSEFEGARTWFENTDIIADTYSFGEQACHFNEAHGVIVSFIYNMACGNIAAAIISLAKPAIMCRLPWQSDGSMCQTHGCLFGPFGSSLVQGKAKIRKLITSGSLLRNRTSQ
jgi:hypothetical protein